MTGQWCRVCAAWADANPDDGTCPKCGKPLPTASTQRCAGCRRIKLCRLRKVDLDVFGSIDKWLCAQCEAMPGVVKPPRAKVHLDDGGGGGRCGIHLRNPGAYSTTDDPAKVTCMSCQGLEPQLWAPKM